MSEVDWSRISDLHEYLKETAAAYHQHGDFVRYEMYDEWRKALAQLDGLLRRNGLR